MKSLHLFIERFVDARLKFVAGGGFAGVLNGSSYVTDDLDVCGLLRSEIVEKLRKALGDFRLIHRLTTKKFSFLEHPLVGQKMANLHLETGARVVDVLGNILGLGDFNVLNQHAIAVPLFGRRGRVVSPAALIRAKEAKGREKNLLTAKKLRAIAAKREQAK